MRTFIRFVAAQAVLFSSVLLVASACTDEKIIEVERTVFNAPPDASSGFLGYFDASQKLTTCGNCHVGKQGDWETTAHAGAVQTLQAVDARDFCYNCHTVNERGNSEIDPSGWSIVQDTSYYDVQCESCHGPGLQHVENPDALQPLATIVADTGATTGCGECHSGTHHPFVDQWLQSRHGSTPAWDGSASTTTNSRCMPCHEGKTAIAVKFDNSANYLEKDDATPQPLSCAVCHDPHGSPNDAQLRAPIDVASADHLCVRCHARRGTPPSSHGPHAPQGLLVLGENVGWIPPAFAYDTATIIGTHGSEANPKLCATCHVPRFTVTDPETGDFVFESVGHLFEAIACLDAEGLPTTGPCTVSERDFRACSASGCHGSETAARSAYTVVVGRLERLLDDLWFDTDGNGIMDVTDGGVLPQVVAQGDTAELNVDDDVVTVAEGALWNAMLAFTDSRPWFGDGEAFGIHFSAHKGSGNGVHNPFLLEALLSASIDAVVDEYGVTPSAQYDPTMLATPPPGLVVW